MNKDLPKILLHHYEQLVEENKVLKARIKEMEDEKAEYGNLKKFCTFMKSMLAILEYKFDFVNLVKY